MGETLIVHAVVPEGLKKQFEICYQNEHLPEAHEAFGSYEAYRGWSLDDPETHFAVYRFNKVDAVQTITDDGVLDMLVAKFDERWQGKVNRTREIIETEQEITQRLK